MNERRRENKDVFSSPPFVTIAHKELFAFVENWSVRIFDFQ